MYNVILYLSSSKIDPLKKWKNRRRIVPRPILFSLRGKDEEAFWGRTKVLSGSRVSPLCFTGVWGQNDVTFAGRRRRRRLVGSGVLASFEKMKMRPPDAGKKSVDKAGRQTFDGEQPPVWLEEKLQKKSIDPSFPASCEPRRHECQTLWYRG